MDDQRETKIGVERPFMKLIEDHEPDIVEGRVALQHAGEHALGDDFDACVATDARVSADAKANPASDGFAEGGSHAIRRGACGDAPRLEHHDLAAVKP